MTRILMRVVIGLFAVVALLVVVAGAVGLPQVRPVLVRQLGEVLQCPVSIGALVWVPPTGVGVREFEAQSPAGRTQPPWLTAAAVDVHVTVWSLLTRRAFVADVNVLRPTITVEQLADGRLSLPTFQAPAAGPSAPGASPAPSSGGPAILPAHLRVRDGTVIYRDHRLTPAWELTMDDIRVDVQAVPSQVVRYRGSAVIRSPQGASTGGLDVQGETTFDGQTTAAITVTHRDVTHLAPYVQQVMGAAPTAGALTLTAAITGRPEALTVKVHVETQGLAFPAEAMTSAGVSAAQLLPILEDDQHRIALDFTVSGRWDQLQVSWNDLMAHAVQQVLKTLVTQRLPSILLHGVTRALETSVETGELDFKALGQSLEQTLKDQFLPPEPSQDAQSQQ